MSAEKRRGQPVVALSFALSGMPRAQEVSRVAVSGIEEWFLSKINILIIAVSRKSV